MSKILHKCLSWVLVFMLLASLSLTGTLSASADNKTGDGLAEYAMRAYNEGWVYSWGGASPGAVDCSGLIYGYVGSGARTTEDMLASSPETGYVSDGVPDIPGLGLYQPGHVGVYVGGGMFVDARDEISNVCYQSVATKSWVMWFKVNGVSYDTGSSVTNDNQTENDIDSSNTSESAEQEVLSKGSSGTEVQALQERLKELGYFDDNVTQYFGSVTEAALIEFQTAAGLTADGVYGEADRIALLSDNAPVKYVEESENEDDVPETDSDTVNIPTVEYEETESEENLSSDNNEANITEEVYTDNNGENSTQQEFFDDEAETYEEVSEITDTYEDIEGESSEAAVQDSIYRIGEQSSEISNLQYMLIMLKYHDYDITGEFDENTSDSVELFQLDNNLTATGFVDSATLSSVYEKYESEFSQSDEDEEIPENGGLSLGMSGYKVENLQNSLIGWGYLSYGKISEFGLFDEATQAAVIEAQRSFNLDENGTATEKLIEALSVTDDGEASKNEVSPTHESDEVKTPKTAADTKSTNISTAAASDNSQESKAQIKSPKTGDPLFSIMQKNIGEYVNPTLVLLAAGIAFIIIFFAGTVHYWNVSMEKRRQRARKATTVSVYRRGSM